MLRRPAPLLWALGLLGAAFFAGTVRLLQIRLSHGDVYPPYSSLRSDPLGCKVLYESLGAMEGVVSERNFRPWAKARTSAPGTLLVLGMAPAAFGSMDQTGAAFLEDYLRTGGRVVIAFRSDREATNNASEGWPSTNPDNGSGRKGIAPAGKRRKGSDDQKKEEMTPLFMQSHLVDLGARFGVKLSHGPAGGGRTGFATVAGGGEASGARLEPLAWHGSLHFDMLNEGWQAAYRAGAFPVVIRRSYGRGRLALCADSYPFSNEAVFKQPAPGFLLWCLGPSRRFLFDETHLDVSETPGLANLLRQYRLHGFVLGCLLVALLFVWKNAFPLLPPPEEGGRFEADSAPGREAFQGMTGLLRRSIPPNRILRICCDEWRKQFARQEAPAAARLEALLRARAGAAPEPAALYRELQEVLNRKNLK